MAGAITILRSYLSILDSIEVLILDRHSVEFHEAEARMEMRRKLRTEASDG